MSKIKCVLKALQLKPSPQSNAKSVRYYRKVSQRLEKIGEAVDKKDPSNLYESGQTFIHKAFPYRGIIIYSWPVKVHDYASENKEKPKNGKVGKETNVDGTVQNNLQTYYQVLVDTRDSHRKFFNNKNLVVKYFPDHTQKVIEIPDIDYVCHDDIIPYQSTVPAEPIFHPAFYSFFDVRTDPEKGNEFFLRDDMKQAQLTDNSWMCVSDVYKDTTDDIRVTVIPYYMGSRFGSSHTKQFKTELRNIEKLGEKYNYIDNGELEDCTLTKKMPSYQFYDNILLESAAAQMWGEFSLERADESRTRCTIPVIRLSVLDNQNLRLSITDLKNTGS